MIQYGLRVIQYGLRVMGRWVQIGVYSDWSITRCPYLQPAQHRCFCQPPFKRFFTALSSFHSLHLPAVSRSPSFKPRAALFQSETYNLSGNVPSVIWTSLPDISRMSQHSLNSNCTSEPSCCPSFPITSRPLSDNS